MRAGWCQSDAILEIAAPCGLSAVDYLEALVLTEAVELRHHEVQGAGVGHDVVLWPRVEALGREGGGTVP